MAVREKTDYIVIHCSDTPDDRDVDMETIKQWHVEDNGWSDIGYHFVIKRKNSVSVGVCLVGRTEFDERQFSALRDTVQLLLRLYPDSKVVGHHDIDDSKTCPNFNVAEWFTSTSPSIDRP